MEEAITFEFIREIHRKEKAKKGLELEELPENFFSLVSRWIVEREKLYEEKRDPSLLIEIENARKLVKEIISQRQRKLVLSALLVLRGEAPPENMLPQEEVFFDKLVQLLSEYKSLVEAELTGDYAEEIVKELKENLEALKESEEEEEVEKEEKEESKVKEEKIEESVKERQEKEEYKEEERPEPPREKLIKVRALNNIPRFVDENMRTYGPYRIGDIFELPEDIAKLLLSRKLVEEVKE